MKIKLPLFCLLFLVNNNLAFGLEPSVELIAKVNEADLIIVGKPVEIKEVERIDYQLSDFKLKTLVWECEKREIPEILRGLKRKIDPHAKTDQVAEWICCSEKMKKEIQDDGEGSSMTTTSSKECIPFNSPTGYLTGRVGKYYDIFLNGREISEEEYMNYELKKAQEAGRPKFSKKEITILVERIIKSKEVLPKIIIDSESGTREKYEGAGYYKYPFRENDPHERVLFLRRIENGHYSLVVYSAGRNAADMAIKDGYITMEEGEKQTSTVLSENMVQGSSPELPAAKEEIETGQPAKISVDDYVAMINAVMQKPSILK